MQLYKVCINIFTSYRTWLRMEGVDLCHVALNDWMGKEAISRLVEELINSCHRFVVKVGVSFLVDCNANATHRELLLNGNELLTAVLVC